MSSRVSAFIAAWQDIAHEHGYVKTILFTPFMLYALAVWEPEAQSAFSRDEQQRTLDEYEQVDR